MLGGGGWPIQYSNLGNDALRASASHRYAAAPGSYDLSASPSYDPSTPTDNGAAASQAASDADNQAIQEMNDTNAMNASMAAAEEQNDAANAAASLQTEINAGM